MAAPASARVRMYRLDELGDCFLVTFTAGQKRSHLLVDCGSFRNSAASVQRLATIAQAIAKELAGKPLDVVVGTHQHNDHVSGFVHCEKAFRKMGVGQVWLSWLDHPTDKQAQAIGEVHNNLKANLWAARNALRAANGADQARPGAARSLELLDDILGFYGAQDEKTPPELPAKGIAILRSLGKAKPEYLEPGRTLSMPGLPAGSVRVHVLGPPRKDDLLYRKDPRKGESYDHALAAAGVHALKLLNATLYRSGDAGREEQHYPFNEEYKLREGTHLAGSLAAVVGRYREPSEDWRAIDDAWMETAGALALYLDTFTNNSSLVLAIELVKSGKVLLFAADAQTGNWLSWKDVKWENDGVDTVDLLERTVFYKVGHHASHNATLPDVFELMTHPDLVALIPVHKQDPNITKVGGWKMPATNLFKRLRQRTENRVLQMDGVNPPACDPDTQAKAAWKRVRIKPRIDSLAVELDFKG